MTRLDVRIARFCIILFLGGILGCENGRAPVTESGVPFATDRTLFGKPIVAESLGNVTRVDDGDTIEVTKDNGDRLAQLENAAREKKLNIWADAEPITKTLAGSKPQLSKISMLAWNVESDGSDFQVIAEQLKGLSGHAIYGLSEVDGQAFDVYQRALGESFQSIRGTHKHNDHLQLIYDSDQLELLGWNEIDEVAGIQLNRPDRAMRSPLLARFKQLETGAEFQVVLNHLARGDAKFREQQAAGLREWGRQQSLPTFCIGDFNFDYVFATDNGNEAFSEFLRDNVWTWIRPAEMIDSNWYDEDGDGVDDFPGSLLDFLFVAGPAKDVDWNSQVIVRDGDFPDNAETSDHRPIVLTLITD